MATLKPQSNGPFYSNTVIGTLTVDGWAVSYIWYSDDGPGCPLLAVPNVTAYPSTASVPVTVLLYIDPLLCGFAVPIKELVGGLA